MGPTGGAGRGTTTRIAGPETAPGALRRRGLSRGSEIGTAEPPPPPSFLARLARHRTSHLYSPHALASMDGVRIRLPGRLDSLPPGQIADRYRLLALEQAARAHRARGPPFPPGMRCFGISTCSPKLPRSTQRWCACSLGLLRLSVRPGGKLRTPGRSFASPPIRTSRSRTLVRGLLAADPALPPVPFVVAETSETSRQWAEAHRLTLVGLGGPYRA
jgi:hypothetical protein